MFKIHLIMMDIEMGSFKLHERKLTTLLEYIAWPPFQNFIPGWLSSQCRFLATLAPLHCTLLRVGLWIQLGLNMPMPGKKKKLAGKKEYFNLGVYVWRRKLSFTLQIKGQNIKYCQFGKFVQRLPKVNFSRFWGESLYSPTYLPTSLREHP